MKNPMIESVTEEELAPYRENLFAVLNAFPQEAAYVQQRLVEGEINGRTYGEGCMCACLFGTIGYKQKWGWNERFLAAQKFHRPIVLGAEDLFYDIEIGHTPANCKRAAIAYLLIEQWMAQRS